MPRLRGDALCRRVRADPALAGTRILLATSHALNTVRDCAADAYLLKPFTVEAVEQAVAPLLAVP